MNDKTVLRNKRIILIIICLMIMIGITIGVSYAFFNYTRTGSENTVGTGIIKFSFEDNGALTLTNQFPISESELTNEYKIDFSISAHNTIPSGATFDVYAVHGDDMDGKTWLTDDIIKMKLVAPSSGDGFTITNNYATATNPTYTNGKVLLATGLVKNTTQLTTKNFTLYMWVDDAKAFISSTTKRATLAEGNPSLADATEGVVIADRYMKNDNELTTVKLYPAKEEAQGKIIYTTKEFSDSHYTIKIRVESNDAKS